MCTRDSNRAEAKAKEKAAKKKKRDNIANDYPKQFDLTKKVIQKWVNHVRDADRPCISCGTENPTIVYCGGHYKTAGGHKELALDTLNIHKQCNYYCNSKKSGNISGDKNTHGYIEGLNQRYGEWLVEWLNGPHEQTNYLCCELIEIRAYYNRLIREGCKDDSDRPYRRHSIVLQ